MMTQGQLEKLPAKLVKALSTLENQIMSDIVRRIYDNGFSTASADWQITRLEQLGKSEKEIQKYVKNTLKVSQKEIERIFSDEAYKQYYGYERAYKYNGKQQVKYEENKGLQQVIDACKKQLLRKYENLGNSMGFAIRDSDGRIKVSLLMDFYRSTLDTTILGIQTGAFDYNSALKRAISTMTNSGVRWVDYDSGHHNRIDVACRRAVLTGFRQVQGYINQSVADELGTDRYEVSYHIGARPTHQPWQGKVYTMDGLEEICGLGSVTGLHGANCYHDYTPFVDGYSTRNYSDSQLSEMMAAENEPREYCNKQYTTYEALQEQRKRERSIRKSRREIDLLQKGKANNNDVELLRAKYRNQMAAYKDFSKKMKLPTQYDRIYQDGLQVKMKK